MEQKEGGKMTLIIICFKFVRMQALIRSSYSGIERKSIFFKEHGEEEVPEQRQQQLLR